MEADRRRANRALGQTLPQWNLKLDFSAQQPSAQDDRHASHKEKRTTTPLGKPRRVLVGKGTEPAGGTEVHAGNQPASLNIGVDNDKTPTVCLFQRFSESLTISTPSASVGNILVQQACTTNVAQKSRRSVAFGTPSMLTYTPAGQTADPVPQPATTPLWPNAGHTPYSLAGTDAIKGCIREFDPIKDRDQTYSGAHSSCTVITDTGSDQTPAAMLKTCLRTSSSNVQSAATAAASSSDANSAIPAATFHTVGSDDKACQPGERPSSQTATCDSTFTSFCASAVSAEPSNIGEGTPVLVRLLGDVAASSASVSDPSEAPDADGSRSLPIGTPKSKLKQPARIPVSATRPAIPTELKQLIGDEADGKMATTEQSLLGSCDVLSPVRSKKQQQHRLGATDQVLTPVRRSARKVSKQLLDNARIAPMLEATNYCYQPNEALGDSLRHV